MKRNGKCGPAVNGKTITVPASVVTKPAEKDSGGKQSDEGQKGK